MYKATSLNLAISLFYSLIITILFNTGYIYAVGITTVSFRYLLIMPLIIITLIFNGFFIYKIQSNKNVFIIIFKLLSGILTVMMSAQLFFVANIFITFTTSAKILIHVVDGMMLLAIIIILIYIKTKLKH